MKKNYSSDTTQGKSEIARAILLHEIDKPDLIKKPYHTDIVALEKYTKCLEIVQEFARQGKFEYESDEASQPLSLHTITLHLKSDHEGLYGTEFKGRDLSIIFGLMEDVIIDIDNEMIMLSSALYKKGTQGK